jgi:hypothetical protein
MSRPGCLPSSFLAQVIVFGKDSWVVCVHHLAPLEGPGFALTALELLLRHARCCVCPAGESINFFDVEADEGASADFSDLRIDFRDAGNRFWKCSASDVTNITVKRYAGLAQAGSNFPEWVKRHSDFISACRARVHAALLD